MGPWRRRRDPATRWRLPGHKREKSEGETDGEEPEEEDGQGHGNLRCSGVALAGAVEEARTARSSGTWTPSA